MNIDDYYYTYQECDIRDLDIVDLLSRRSKQNGMVRAAKSRTDQWGERLVSHWSRLVTNLGFFPWDMTNQNFYMQFS
jgi:hypothetical protein